jgi:hypothetical protein
MLAMINVYNYLPNCAFKWNNVPDEWGLQTYAMNYENSITPYCSNSLGIEHFYFYKVYKNLIPACNPPACTATGTGVTAVPVAYGVYTSGWTLTLAGPNPAADVNVYCKKVQ